jgi:aminoglycoside/choline kinase family phosphotransferase
MTEPGSQENLDEAILAWLEDSGRRVRRLTPLTGDVSARRYFRSQMISGQSAIVAYYPETIRSACSKFIETSRLLTGVGVRVPDVLSVDCKRGLVLLEDAGSATLYDQPTDDWDRLHRWYSRAAVLVGRIQSIPVEAARALNPALDATLLWRELEQTWNLFLEPRRLIGEGRFTDRLRAVLRELCRELAEEPPLTCHRDFMVRNLVPLEPGPDLVVLDHQDLRPGPRWYDLASLLNDSLFPPAAVERRLLTENLPGEVDWLGYHRAAAQRTLKAVGTYEAFSRRGFDRHRRLIAPTLARAADHLRQLPEASAIAETLTRRWLRLPPDGGAGSDGESSSQIC